MSKRFPVAVAVAAMAVGGAWGQDPQPLPRAELDKRAKKLAYDAADVGSGLFNAGERSATPKVNYEGTARLYQGTLLALVQMLDHRPDLVQEVQRRLEAAGSMNKPQDRAFELRKGLDAVMRIGAKTVTLWDRLGGEQPVTAVVKAFVAKTAANPKVDFTRGGKFKLDATAVDHSEKMLVEMISAATGGPLKYTGKGMKEVHAGMAITEEQFAAMAEDLKATLQQFKVPDDTARELLAIVAFTKSAIVEGKK